MAGEVLTLPAVACFCDDFSTIAEFCKKKRKKGKKSI